VRRCILLHSRTFGKGKTATGRTQPLCEEVTMTNHTVSDHVTRQDRNQTPADHQVEKDTGLPVNIAPDGEKQPEGDAKPEDALRIDPNSRIPKPVPPDLA
jgi:hypothetical protein